MKYLVNILSELFLLAGMSSVCYGVYKIHIPSAFIVIGLMLIILGYPKNNIKDKNVYK